MILINRSPLSAAWIMHEDRTPTVRLKANPNYWDTERGPHLEEVIFRNDLDPKRALDLITTTDGEVDILSGVSPDDAETVKSSQHARLVSKEEASVVAGVINRDAEGLPLGDSRARLALNLALDREAMTNEAVGGMGTPLSGLTPPSWVAPEHRLEKPVCDRERAVDLWREAQEESGDSETRALVVGAPEELEAAAGKVAADLRVALGVEVEVRVYRGEKEEVVHRNLAEKRLPQEWDIFLMQQGVQLIDAPPLELHRAFVGETGQYRAGPVLPEFETLYAKLVGETDEGKQARISAEIEDYVRGESLALFLYSPPVLYAVNRHVDFTPYRTSFELSECRVGGEHWSRRSK